MTDVADEWIRCGSNEISKLAGRIRARRQRRIVGDATLLAATVCVGVAIWLYPRPDQGPDFAGISCERVMELSNAHMKKQLSPELQDQVSRHIALCPKCCPMYKGMPRVSEHFPGETRQPLELARYHSHR